MSDDKREKLREYLRNNRPKSKINLGNSSDNIENSNKNLEDDLNLDNSNLNNSQISNNKTNSNKRDYDKEPLFIKNHNPDVSSFRGFCFLVLVFISLFIVDIPTDRKIFNFLLPLFLLVDLQPTQIKAK
ncbi:hypothetical protein [Campylobacter ureolyticus]|uniref:Uncharacterized protein n=1 Tax=Campylobacter ureolyticus TaxID=827 RepID=A0A9Q4PT01_9BACT|nr:hypothetical protein [Campylobacter ureolyticus]MCZ6160552.1 hypothetical protein [Campylobacter ureolyticus]MCZ6164287.1 hypothetical protein [Campylobacter ureolyticus]MCZ6166141.1 hypothetical protein [Campylobacter ureolyticus]MCZ6167830.1 hypothetical protein [Campylobacter ureolyticus]MCZ6174543.1 hypothetical protein [Campylobacter ureolyticus]